ncbi:MAG: TIGR03085 family metal-binding protein, partial [Actinomycetes bacterium]
MTAYAQQERAALSDLFDQVGPSAPTLCEGWKTADLAAHLVIRERRPDAAPGMIIPLLSGHTDAVQRSVRDGGPWPQLVDKVRSGPPLPFRLGPVDEAINTVEYFVHHEDVRRAQADWAARPLDPGLARALWSRLTAAGRILGRRAPAGVVFVSPGHGRATMKAGQPEVTVRGDPGELVRFAFGRSQVARVELQGDDVSVE